MLGGIIVLIEKLLKEMKKLKIAIIYTTVGGTTKECAELLKRELKNQTVDIFEIGENMPVLSEYDRVVVGFPIRWGRASRAAAKFIKENRELLKNTSAAYYICCGFVDCFDDYARKCIPQDLYSAAVAVDCLGGSLDPSRVKGFDRIVVKAVRAEILGGGDNADQRSDMVLPTIMEENISQFADKLRGV
jgi:menaquinone-dependent protoporphyrinogen oxidase